MRPFPKRIATLYILSGLMSFSCRDNSHHKEQNHNIYPPENKPVLVQDSIVYETDNLIVQKLSDHTYVHTSFLDTDDFGKVSCNGMIIINDSKAIVFDTPVDNESSEELINYLNEELHATIKAVVPTHFHADCVGGLETFNKHKIPCFTSKRTLELLKGKNPEFMQPITAFDDTMEFSLGDKKVYADYFGEGHTEDNIIGYFPKDKALFGGCLIKSMNASKGNLEDANVSEWSSTVEKIKKKYSDANIVIPGHGTSGNLKLLDYTIELFQ